MFQPSPAPRSESLEQDIAQCIPHVCERTDSAAASWIATNEYEVDCARFIVTQPLTSGDYNLLQLVALSSSYSVESRTAGICGFTTEQLIQEREEGDTFIFTGLDLILALAVPDPKTLVISLASAHWLLKENVTGPYVKALQDQFLKLRASPMTAFISQVHRVDAVLTAVCNGNRKDYLWLGCPTCA